MLPQTVAQAGDLGAEAGDHLGRHAMALVDQAGSPMSQAAVSGPLDQVGRPGATRTTPFAKS